MALQVTLRKVGSDVFETPCNVPWRKRRWFFCWAWRYWRVLKFGKGRFIYIWPCMYIYIYILEFFWVVVGCRKVFFVGSFGVHVSLLSFCFCSSSSSSYHLPPSPIQKKRSPSWGSLALGGAFEWSRGVEFHWECRSFGRQDIFFEREVGAVLVWFTKSLVRVWWSSFAGFVALFWGLCICFLSKHRGSVWGTLSLHLPPFFWFCFSFCGLLLVRTFGTVTSLCEQCEPEWF